MIICPSQNAWKVRLLLSHLGLEYERVPVSIFEGESHSEAYLEKNPAGAVPVLEVEPGRTIAESNAILCYLAEGTPYLPQDRFERAQVMQWLFFEQSYVEPQIGSLRYWTLTGKLAKRSEDAVAGKRASSLRALAALERHLARRTFLVCERYTIADMAIYAYAAHAEEAGLDPAPYLAFRAWISRIEAQPGFLRERFPYSIDPHASRELG
ncbi:MAG TPA: glutathione S-transferase family protein [Stellaceae bacterium]|jgi:glutathione S-transferase|nr:glutathione S-transferase family protein [Stellaceae bacterium]